MTRSDIDAAVGRLAATQHGIASDRQLLELGMSRAAIRRGVASNRWLRVESGVIRLAGAPVTWESQVLAHVLAAGHGAVASHRTAAVLHRLEGFRPGPPELAIPAERHYVRSGIRLHRSSDLDRTTPVRRLQIPVTPVDRTLLDLGAVVRLERVHLAVDDARRRDLTNWDQLLDCLVLHARRGRDGVGTLRAILEQHFGEVAVTDSGFERLVLTRLVNVGIARPVLQHEITVAGRTYRLDLAYPDRRLAIELDGRVHLNHEVWEKDHARQNALILAGWTVLRFTWRDYKHHWLRMLGEIRTAMSVP